jgi:DNA-binding phage protein
MKKKTKTKIGSIKVASGDLLTDMLDQETVREELAACLIQGDSESFKEILAAFVDAYVNKKQLGQKSSLSRDTLYRVIRKENISVDSVFKILNAG